MEVECILKLNNCRDELLASLEFDLLSPGLIQHGVITGTEYERIRDLSCNKDKIVAFLDLLPSKNLDTFTRFVKSLEEDYDWLAFSLKNTQITPEEVQTYKRSQNNNKHIGEKFHTVPGLSGAQAGLPGCSTSGVVNNCETMSVSQSSSSSGFSQDEFERRLDQERSDRLAIERDRLAIERDREQRLSIERDREQRLIMERDREQRLAFERDREQRQREFERSRVDMFERDRGRYDRPDRSLALDRRHDFLDRDRLERADYLDRAYGHDRFGRGFEQERPRNDVFDRGNVLLDRYRQDNFHRTPSQENLERMSNGGFVRMGSPVHANRVAFGSPLHSSSGGFGSPLHSSEFSLKSSESGEDRLDSLSQVGEGKRRQDMEGDITEEMINFVMLNPRIMKRWQSLAHSTGLSDRVEVIKARIRNEGRDHDEHVGEFLREWKEQKPETATLGGLVHLLKTQKFNDTALKLEDGTYKKGRP